MDTFLVTCEHGGNDVPAEYQPWFAGHRDLLGSHRGYDAGALVMAEQLAREFSAPLVASTTTRLLIDLNRSLGHRQSFSEVSRDRPPAVRAQIAERHHRPHWEEVAGRIESAVATGDRLIHIASHSFTPELDGVTRTADVGLLYDPRRPGEVEISARWKAALAQAIPGLRVRRNYPYAGDGDGLTTSMRRRFAASEYVGIELEVNQAMVVAGADRWSAVRSGLIESLRSVWS